MRGRRSRRDTPGSAAPRRGRTSPCTRAVPGSCRPPRRARRGTTPSRFQSEATGESSKPDSGAMPSANHPVALVAAPLHQVHEQRLHHALRRVAVVSHQVDRELLCLRARARCWRTPRSARRARSPPTGNRDQVRLVEEPEREALLGARLACEPVVGHRAQLAQDSWNVRRLDDAERAAVLLQPANRLAIPRRVAALERERRRDRPSLPRPA